MKKFVVAVCLAITAVVMSPSVLASNPKDYVARLNEDGKYCARVEVIGINGLPSRRTKCRTLEAWEEAGYTVGAKEVSEVE